jgi:glutaredoxin
MATQPTLKPISTTTKTNDTTNKVEDPIKVNPLRLRDTTSNHLWTVIGLSDCEWTNKAVELLKERGERYKYVELNAEWQRRLVIEHNTRRIPAVFRGSGYFGSFEVLEGYYKASFIADSERF